MKHIWLASMVWPERLEAICVGTNKRKTMKEALLILKEIHGKGEVDRPRAMCSIKLTYDDIEMEKLPFFNSGKTNE